MINRNFLSYKKTCALRIFFFAIISFNLFYSCKQKHSLASPVKYSQTQKYLFNLTDNYVSEYSTLKLETQKDSLMKEFLQKFSSFLDDTLGGFVDSILVTVDTISNNNLFLSSQFHSRNIEFKFGMQFHKDMDAKKDSMFHYLLSLKPGKTILMNFIKFGSMAIFPPDENNGAELPIKIFAFPQPTMEQMRSGGK